MSFTRPNWLGKRWILFWVVLVLLIFIIGLIAVVLGYAHRKATALEAMEKYGAGMEIIADSWPQNQIHQSLSVNVAEDLKPRFFFQTVFSMGLSGSPSINAEELRCLRAFRKLNSVYFNISTADDDHFLEISKLKSLRSVSAVGAHITPKGLTHLTKLPNLKGLNLSGNELTARHFEVIGELQNLKVLNLDFCKLDSSYLEPIAKSGATFLSLEKTGLTAKDIKRLMELNPKITHLMLTASVEEDYAPLRESHPNLTIELQY